MIKNTIYWKDRALNQEYDFAIVGSGIVGLCSAILLKIKSPRQSVILFERAQECGGASIRNAGFICYGSPTELLDDLRSTSEDSVIDTIRDRYLGIQLLSQLVALNKIDYRGCKGAELFFDSDAAIYQQVLDKLDYLNELFEEATGDKIAFVPSPHNDSIKVHGKVMLPYEGSIDPYKLYGQLLRRAYMLGVVIMRNTFFSLEAKAKLPTAAKYLICTNAYTEMLVPNLDLKPVRNQVFVTQKVEKLLLPNVYHYDKGYIYFRKIDDRILIGGARNQLGSGEEVDDFGNTLEAKQVLLSFLHKFICNKTDWKFDFQWSGILGVGSQKKAIVKQVYEDTYLGVRLGGMGVAIGAKVADRLTDLVLR